MENMSKFSEETLAQPSSVSDTLAQPSSVSDTLAQPGSVSDTPDKLRDFAQMLAQFSSVSDTLALLSSVSETPDKLRDFAQRLAQFSSAVPEKKELVYAIYAEFAAKGRETALRERNIYTNAMEV